MTARSSAALMTAALLMLTTVSASGAEQASWAKAMVALRQQQLEQETLQAETGAEGGSEDAVGRFLQVRCAICLDHPSID